MLDPLSYRRLIAIPVLTGDPVLVMQRSAAELYGLGRS
jgi:hypothetical protein